MQKLLLLALLLFPFAIHAQPGTTQYPTSLDTSTTLPVSADSKVTFLTASASNSVTTFTVNSTAGFPSSGVLQMPSGELVSYTGTTSTTFTGLTRGFSGTNAQAYSANQVIRLSLSSAYVNGPRGAAVALEMKIGIDGSGGTATPTNINDVLMVTATGASRWKPIPSGSGEANTASNVNIGGVGVFKQKSGVDLQFKGVNAGSAKVTVTNDAANNEIDVDISEANLDHANIGGTAPVAHGGTGSTTASGARTNLGLVIGTDIEAHDSDLTTIAGLAASNDDVIQRKSGVWTNRTIAQLKSDLLDNSMSSYTPTWSNLTVGNGTVTAKYIQVGKLVTCRITIVFGSTTSVSGFIQFSLPVTSISYPGTATTEPLGLVEMFDSGVGQYVGRVVWASTTTVGIGAENTSGTYGTLVGTSGSIPFSWGTADELSCEFSYEAP